MTITGIYSTRQVFIDGDELTPHESLAVHKHSLDGFSWGYGGSGPSQLALAIMLHITGKPDRYQDFKWRFIAPLPQSDFKIEIDIIKWINDK